MTDEQQQEIEAARAAFQQSRQQVDFGGGDGPGGDDIYDRDWFNDTYAVVQLGGHTLVLEENFKGFDPDKLARIPAADRVRFLSFGAFKEWMLPKQCMGEDGKPIAMSGIWLKDRKRRQYRGVVFDPGTDPGENDLGYYNLWRGWSVEPSEKGSCDIFKDHVRTNLARGDEDRYRYIMAWAAQMVQQPASKPGISLVLRGGMGTGKTIFGQVLGRLMGPHYILVDDPHYVTGNFNAHMASCLLLQADEGFWAGDPAAAGRLKGLVTSTHQMVEPKGKDAVQMANHIRLLVTSNSDWVVPAGPDERRFAVFDVGDTCAQDQEYFGSLFRELEQDGGYARLLWELMAFDLQTVELNRLPDTGALMEQKIASLNPVDKWWFECLRRGWIRAAQDITDPEWPVMVKTEAVFSSYVTWADRIGVRFKKADSEVGRTLQRLVPGLTRARRRDESGRRDYVYQMPSLAACREAFAAHIRASEMDWEDDEIAGSVPAVPGSPVRDDEI